jgi:hypothetical protein
VPAPAAPARDAGHFDTFLSAPPEFETHIAGQIENTKLSKIAKFEKLPLQSLKQPLDSFT